VLNRFAILDEQSSNLLSSAMGYKVSAAILKRKTIEQITLINNLMARPSKREDVIIFNSGQEWICQQQTDAAFQDILQEFPDAYQMRGTGETPEEAAVSFDLMWTGIIPGEYK